MAVFTKRTVAGNDEGYWSTSTLNKSTSPVRMGNNGSSQNTFFRFTNVTIPNAATINSATLTLTAQSTTSTTNVHVTISGEDADNPSSPTSVADANGRATTTATVAWNPGAWTVDLTYSPSDLATIIQEIVDRGGWASGNAMIIYLKDNGSTAFASKTVTGYTASTTKAAQISIDYTAGGGGGGGSIPIVLWHLRQQGMG